MFFNRIILFFEGIILIVLVCCSIDIYQVYTGVEKKNASYYFSICAISTAGLYMSTLIIYLYCNFGKLGAEQQKNLVGAAYTHLAVGKASRSVLVFLLL